MDQFAFNIKSNVEIIKKLDPWGEEEVLTPCLLKITSVCPVLIHEPFYVEWENISRECRTYGKSVCLWIGEMSGVQIRFYNACSHYFNGLTYCSFTVCQPCDKSFKVIVLFNPQTNSMRWILFPFIDKETEAGELKVLHEQVVKAGCESRPVWFQSWLWIRLRCSHGCSIILTSKLHSGLSVTSVGL